MLHRIAAVSFLNTRPLIRGLDEDPSVHLVLKMPSRLPGLLESGEADVALVPVVEVFRGRTGGIVPVSGIACRGAVDSVKLFGRGSLAEIKRVRADRGSRTSVALADVLLREQAGTTAEFRSAEPRVGDHPAGDEAVLVIGDRCFEYEKGLRGSGVWVRDLGTWWHEFTGLPFVFAVWALRPGLEAGRIAELAALLAAARDRGLDALGEIAATASGEGLLGHGGEATAEAIDYYFRHDLTFELGEDEERGMRRFHEFCVLHGLVPDTPFPTVLRG